MFYVSEIGGLLEGDDAEILSSMTEKEVYESSLRDMKNVSWNISVPAPPSVLSSA